MTVSTIDASTRSSPEQLAQASLTGARAMLAVAVLVGTAVRLLPVMRAPFPLGDGGMFAVMARDLEQNGFRLPASTTYNDLHIPFAYPPLGFYLAALLDRFTPLSLLDAVRLLPPFFSVLTLLAFARLARRLLGPGLAAALATLCFAVLSRSYNWEIVGGGLTRSPGFFFALLAIDQFVQLVHTGSRRALALTTVFASLTALSHLEMTLFVASSALVFMLAEGRTWRVVRDAAIVGGGVLALTAPWWATVLAWHGLSPFEAALASRGAITIGLVNLFFLDTTQEAVFPLGRTLGLAGLGLALVHRRWTLPAWYVTLFVLDPRKGMTLTTVPLALLVGPLLAESVLPWFAQLAQRGRAWRWAGMLLGSYAFVYALLSNGLAVWPQLTALGAGERAAMAWMATQLPAGARTLVLTGDEPAMDWSSEWFPALTGHASVATVQGREWLPGFHQHIRDTMTLQQCTMQTTACLDQWAAATGQPFDYVYIVKRPSLRTSVDVYQQVPDAHGDCCTALRLSLQASPGYQLVFENAAVAVFRRLPGGPHTASTP